MVQQCIQPFSFLRRDLPELVGAVLALFQQEVEQDDKADVREKTQQGIPPTFSKIVKSSYVKRKEVRHVRWQKDQHKSYGSDGTAAGDLL